MAMLFFNMQLRVTGDNVKPAALGSTAFCFRLEQLYCS